MNGYGTTAPPALNGRHTTDGADEEQSLLGKPNRPSILTRLRKNMKADVSRSWADVVLLLCYVVTGLLDSASTQVWGAFVSMQTGRSLTLCSDATRQQLSCKIFQTETGY